MLVCDSDANPKAEFEWLRIAPQQNTTQSLLEHWFIEGITKFFKFLSSGIETRAIFKRDLETKVLLSITFELFRHFESRIGVSSKISAATKFIPIYEQSLIHNSR